MSTLIETHSWTDLGSFNRAGGTQHIAIFYTPDVWGLLTYSLASWGPPGLLVEGHDLHPVFTPEALHVYNLAAQQPDDDTLGLLPVGQAGQGDTPCVIFATHPHRAPALVHAKHPVLVHVASLDSNAVAQTDTAEKSLGAHLQGYVKRACILTKAPGLRLHRVAAAAPVMDPNHFHGIQAEPSQPAQAGC